MISRASFLDEPLFEESDLVDWVKDALTHYWGGPKLNQQSLDEAQDCSDVG